ncbi:unnamed protein product, partial [Prorocentrum cordatum]
MRTQAAAAAAHAAIGRRRRVRGLGGGGARGSALGKSPLACSVRISHPRMISLQSVGLQREGYVRVQGGSHRLWYRVVRPLGCGRSDAPPAESGAYSIEQSVADLREVLLELGLRRYHLYGQSWGGVLAYEHLRSAPAGGCVSLVLSSVPSSVRRVEAHAERLLAALRTPGGSRPSAAELPDLFRRRHQCRTPEQPGPLRDAYSLAGTTWRGSAAISEWELQGALPAGLPALCLRGEHDFVGPGCAERWRPVLPGLRRLEALPGCAHHGLLEAPELYLRTVGEFLAQIDLERARLEAARLRELAAEGAAGGEASGPDGEAEVDEGHGAERESGDEEEGAARGAPPPPGHAADPPAAPSEEAAAAGCGGAAAAEAPAGEAAALREQIGHLERRRAVPRNPMPLPEADRIRGRHQGLAVRPRGAAALGAAGPRPGWPGGRPRRGVCARGPGQMAPEVHREVAQAPRVAVDVLRVPAGASRRRRLLLRPGGVGGVQPDRRPGGPDAGAGQRRPHPRVRHLQHSGGGNGVAQRD